MEMILIKDAKYQSGLYHHIMYAYIVGVCECVFMFFTLLLGSAIVLSQKLAHRME